MVTAHDDVEVELWGLERKRELFERVFDVRVDVTVAAPVERAS